MIACHYPTHRPMLLYVRNRQREMRFVRSAHVLNTRVYSLISYWVIGLSKTAGGGTSRSHEHSPKLARRRAAWRSTFPAYQGNNREIRRSGRGHHRIYVEKTFYLSYLESNSLRNKTGNYLCRCREFDPLIKESFRLIVKHLRLALLTSVDDQWHNGASGPR